MTSSTGEDVTVLAPVTGAPGGGRTWHEVMPALFLVTTTTCFWPLFIPVLGVTVRMMGRSLAPAIMDLDSLMV